ncbi:MAG: hypothetical protein ACREQ9_05300, partial [Candidatus Binatia bacterium]
GVIRRRVSPAAVLAAVIVVLSGSAGAQETTRELRRELEGMKRQIRKMEEKIRAQEKRIEDLSGAEAEPSRLSGEEAALDQALKELGLPAEAPPPPSAPPALLARPIGAANLRLIDVSLDALFAAGTSTENDESLQSLEGGGHDPRKRGFTVQNVEVSFLGAIDPWLTGEAHLIYFLDPLEGESIFELEEAFLTTQALPYGLQLEAGQFFTEFGRLNPKHPHAWHWIDQPVINTRLFGPDGMRGPGFRLAWLTPLPWFSDLHFGMQNANGETMASFLANDEFFEERAIGGRPFVERDVESLRELVYLGRWTNSWNHGEEVTTLLGVSGLVGPNATGTDAETRIYGTDVVMKWRPANNFRGWPFVLLEAEVMKRDYEADPFAGAGDEDGEAPPKDLFLPGRTLRDWGFYAQALGGFRYGWAGGLRVEHAGGSGDSVDGRSADPFRADRLRLSPLLVWHPSEFSRLRLQYNFDDTDHLEDDAHSVWLGVEFLYGAHPAHTY